jgi:hypothetical protein
MPAVIPRRMAALAGLILLVGCATAGDRALTGEFEGSGRQCQGVLLVQADVIAWHTPFASCAKTSYEILDQATAGGTALKVFLLKPVSACSFAVITLERDLRHPEYWNATGYRSRQDYEAGSDDTLRCNLTRKEAAPASSD